MQNKVTDECAPKNSSFPVSAENEILLTILQEVKLLRQQNDSLVQKVETLTQQNNSLQQKVETLERTVSQLSSSTSVQQHSFWSSKVSFAAETNSSSVSPGMNVGGDTTVEEESLKDEKKPSI